MPVENSKNWKENQMSMKEEEKRRDRRQSTLAQVDLENEDRTICEEIFTRIYFQHPVRDVFDFHNSLYRFLTVHEDHPIAFFRINIYHKIHYLTRKEFNARDLKQLFDSIDLLDHYIS